MILAGPHSVIIHDPAPVQGEDLGYNVRAGRERRLPCEFCTLALPPPPQYYFTPESVGKPRDESCIEQLAELNSYVQVKVLGEPLTEAVLSRFNVVVFTDTPAADLEKYNAYCRAQSPAIGFIAADVRGLAGRAFVDYGPAHAVLDADGEPVRSAILAGVLVQEDGSVLIETHDAKRHGLADGDHVIFREVDGATALNDGVPRKVKNCKPYSFVLEDAPEGLDGLYSGNGVVEQVKVPKQHAFKSWADAVANPDADGGMLVDMDLSKWGRARALHAAFNGMDTFVAKHSALPSPRNDAHAAEVAELATAWATKAGFEAEGVEDVAKQLAAVAAVELPALDAFYGGLVAQEVVKFTGKFTPLDGFLYVDVFEIAPKVEDPADFAGSGDRYHFSSVIFGSKLTETIRGQNVFVVGSGALGCEFLKNFALAGVGTGPSGKITVTDMDNIETSNLNRQFLFRTKDVGHSKSSSAVNAVKVMNPDLEGHITALEDPVGTDTEHIFDDAFWSKLDFVTNALDNVKARGYVDGRCVWFGLPLLESGTLGTKANSQHIFPSLTESYTDSQDPPEDSIPMCTLKNFPNQIEHCIEWSRDNFQGYFATNVQEAIAFAADPEKWLASTAEEGNVFVRRQKLQGVVDTLAEVKSADWKACVHRARLAFDKDYVAQIKQLLHNFPPEHVTKEGTKFWSGPKRCPQVPEFSLDDPLHASYIAHAAALFAYAWGVAVPADFADPAQLAATLADCDIPEWKPKSVRIQAGDDDETKEGGDDDDVVAEGLSKQLAGMVGGAEVEAASKALQAADFEKDDDSNHHIDFITASANLRGWNYRIAEASRHKVKMIAGKIIPAIATTTCAVTGLVMIEMYKTIQMSLLPPAERKVDSLRNAYINLAINSYYAAEPGPPKFTRTLDMDPIMGMPNRAVPNNHTKWERMVINIPATGTVQEVMDAVKAYIETTTKQEEEAGTAPEGKGPIAASDVDVTMLAVGTKMIFSDLFPAHAARLARPFKEVYSEVCLDGAALTEPYVAVGAAAEAGSDMVTVPEAQVIIA